jgi:hypothetical protein
VRTWLLLCASLVYACAGTETGNPSFMGSLGYAAYTSDASVAALSKRDGAANVEQAWIVLGDVRFVEGDACTSAENGELAAKGIGIGDHATGHTERSDLELPEGRYCGVSFPLIVAGKDVGTAPMQLARHSIVIVGKRDDGIAFELRSTLAKDLFLEAPRGGFEMDDTDGSVLIGFDVATWLSAVELDRADAGSDGSVLIDATHNPDLLDEFDRNVQRGVALYRDANASGKVDLEAKPLAEGVQ